MLDTSAWIAAYHHAWITHNAEQLPSYLQKMPCIIPIHFDHLSGVVSRFMPIGNDQHPRKRSWTKFMRPTT